MVRTILFLFYLLILFSTSFLTIPFYLILRLLFLKKAAKAYINFISSWMGFMFVKGTGGRVTVTGLKNLPDKKVASICVIGNHQGFLDIPLLTWKLPFPAGFVAKRSLAYVPLFNLLMFALRCVLLDRKSRKSSVKAIEKGVSSIKKGYPMIIFPEGTRSKSSIVGKFKRGSLKLATRAEAVIVPVTINGTYKSFEEFSRVRSAHITLQIHPPVNTAGMTISDKEGLAERLFTTISASL